jgi:hypothetical protein
MKENTGIGTILVLFTAVKIQVEGFWVLTPLNFVVVYQRFKHPFASIFMDLKKKTYEFHIYKIEPNLHILNL